MITRVDDTICAVATPAGSGGIGIVRVSGSKAIDAARRLVRLHSGRDLVQARSHRLARATVLDGGQSASEALDEGLVVVMRGPQSYTGEDVVEFHCHGGPIVLESVCRALIAQGVRLADPGEFTKRAFLNGKLDLVQAEAVLDTIHATTASSLKLAQAMLQGTVSEVLARLREELIVLLAHIEAAIDFTEEDIEFIERDALCRRLAGVRDELAQLRDSWHEGRLLREGARVAMAGRPNVGKSSLWNALVREDRAIVTPIPGTTRDVLEEFVTMRGLAVRLLDTAGIRESADVVEREGIRRSRAALADADLIYVVLDGSCPLEEDDRRLLVEVERARSIVVVNKADLPAAFGLRELTERAGGRDVITVAAKTGAGLDRLRDVTRDRLMGSGPEPGASVVISRLRHQTGVRLAAEGAERALEAIVAGTPAEMIAMDLRAATDALGEMTGVVTTDDVLARIFQDFCIGK